MKQLDMLPGGRIGRLFGAGDHFMTTDKDKQDPNVTRRNLGSMLALLGGAAGFAALAGCAESAGADETAEQTAVAVDALSGSSFLWIDSVVGSGANLKSTVGSDTSTTSKPAVVVGGYLVPGDGGGGVFYWDTSSSTGDDGGTIIVPTGSVSGRWKRIYSGPLSVKWFGAQGNGALDDTAAIQAAYNAAATLISATVYFPVGTYLISSTITIGSGTTSSINTIGEGSVRTILMWINSNVTGIVALKYWRNKYAKMSGLAMTNGSASGRGTGSIGMLLSGPGSGSQSNGLVFENCGWSGFATGLQAGGGALGTEAASEVAFLNCSFTNCLDGFVASGSGNTLSIWFYGCVFSSNSRYGANLGSGGSISFWGGGSHANGVATICPTGWNGPVRVEGFRFELTPPEQAVAAGSTALLVENCIFTTNTTVPGYGVIGPTAGTTIRYCTFGSSGDTGWLPYDTGSNSPLEMVGNIINGTVPFYIASGNSGSNGLLYSLFGNRYNNAWHGSEVGTVIWPNRVNNNDIVSGTAIFASAQTVQVTFLVAQQSQYKVTLSGNKNETFSVLSKSPTGFLLQSSNLTSVAVVDWVVSR